MAHPNINETINNYSEQFKKKKSNKPSSILLAVISPNVNKGVYSALVL